MSPADQFLLNQWISKRDAQAFKSLTSKYCGMVYGTCVRVLRNAADAEDVAQECFLTLASVPRGPRAPLGAWLHAVATHKALNHRRSEQRRRSREDCFARTARTSTVMHWDDVSPYVDEAIEALPAKVRVAIIGHFVEDQAVTAIAAQEHVTHSAISQRIQKGVLLIRERLNEKGIAITASALAAMFTDQAFAMPIDATDLSLKLGRIALSGTTAAAPHASTSALLGMKGVAAVLAALVALVGVYTFLGRSNSQPVDAASFAEAAPVIPDDMLESKALIRVDSVLDAQPQDTLVSTTVPPQAPPAVRVAEEATAYVEVIDDWREVVKRYRAHQDRIRSLTVEFDDTMAGDYYHASYSSEPGYRETHQWGTMTTDGERVYLEQYRSGDWFGGEIIPDRRPQLHACVYNGSDSFEYHGFGGMDRERPGSLQLWLDARNSMIRDSAFSEGRIYTLYNRYPGSAMLGYPMPTGTRLEEFLYSTHNIALRQEMELVAGEDCYVVDAETDDGTFVVWFDPAHDFNVARFIIAKRAGHLVNEFVLLEGMTHEYAYEVKRFANVDGLWVPKESTYRQQVLGLGGQGFDYVSEHNRTSISLNGVAGESSTYALNRDYIVNGSRWMDTDNPQRQDEFIWYDGKVVPKTGNHSDRSTPAQRRVRDLIASGFGAGSARNE